MVRRPILVICLVFALIAVMSVPASSGWWDDDDRIKGKGALQRETRSIDDVSRIELGTIGVLFIEVGDKMALEVEAQANLLEYIVTDVRRNRLEIFTERGYQLRPTKQIEYHLTVMNLDALIISSSGDVVVGDLTTAVLVIEVESSGDLEMAPLQCPDLEIYISSSGDVMIDRWDGRSLRAELSSSGDLEIGGGTTEEQDVELSSSGDYKARRLDSKTARVRVSSSGDALVRVSDELYARTSSSGDIIYYGNPEVDARSTSSGDIDRGGR